MTTNRELCNKITEVFPEIGVCGIDLNVDYDTKAGAWAIDLERNGHHLKTYLEINEADSCIDGKECVSLGLQVAQLRNNIELMRKF